MCQILAGCSALIGVPEPFHCRLHTSCPARAKFAAHQARTKNANAHACRIGARSAGRSLAGRRWRLLAKDRLDGAVRARSDFEGAHGSTKIGQSKRKASAIASLGRESNLVLHTAFVEKMDHCIIGVRSSRRATVIMLPTNGPFSLWVRTGIAVIAFELVIEKFNLFAPRRGGENFGPSARLVQEVKDLTQTLRGSVRSAKQRKPTEQ